MGKVGRAICIFLPLACTIISAVFQILLGLGGTSSTNSYLARTYFLKLNTTLPAPSGSLGTTGGSANSSGIPSIYTTADGNVIIQPEYTISLFSYCAYDLDNANTNNSTSNTYDLIFCTSPHTNFFFNLSSAFGLSSTEVDTLLGPSFTSANNDYATAAKYVTGLYIAGLVSTAIELLFSIGALFSRLGSLFTTLAALSTAILTTAFSGLVTGTYVVLDGAVNADLNKHGYGTSLGGRAFAYMWISSAFTIAAVILWAFSCCCVSGSSHHFGGGGSGGRQKGSNGGAEGGAFDPKVGGPNQPRGINDGAGGGFAAKMGSFARAPSNVWRQRSFGPGAGGAGGGFTGTRGAAGGVYSPIGTGPTAHGVAGHDQVPLQPYGAQPGVGGRGGAFDSDVRSGEGRGYAGRGQGREGVYEDYRQV
ncbi:hypothetical protein MMC25_007244 [Agyrium rufum]|nr:hypothetical protein [Agyrium rufum]